MVYVMYGYTQNTAHSHNEHCCLTNSPGSREIYKGEINTGVCAGWFMLHKVSSSGKMDRMGVRETVDL